MELNEIIITRAIIDRFYTKRGMWGGGMMFNEIVVQKAALSILEEFGIRCHKYQENYYTSDSVEAISSITAGAMKAGLTIFNCMSMEDVMMRTDKVIGLVLNWSPVQMAGLHIDPLTVKSSFVIDATGHATEVVRVVHQKVPGKKARNQCGQTGLKH